MLGDGFDSGLAAQLFVVLQLEIIVFGVKDDELADSVEIDDGNEIRDQRSPNEHIVRNAKFGVIIRAAVKFSYQILFDVLGRLNRVLADCILAAVEQLEHIAENSRNIGAVEFLNHKQERLRRIAPAVLKRLYIDSHERAGYIGIGNSVLAVNVLVRDGLICADEIRVGIVWVECNAFILAAGCERGVFFTVQRKTLSRAGRAEENPVARQIALISGLEGDARLCGGGTKARGGPHRGRREFADLAGAALSVLEIPFARLEASGAEDLIFGIFPGILRM